MFIERRYWLYGFFGLLLLANVLGVLPYYQWLNFREADRRLARDYEALNQIHESFKLLQDMETAQRGYIITQDSKFLEPLLEVYNLTPEDVTNGDGGVTLAAHLRTGGLPPDVKEKFAQIRATLSPANGTAQKLDVIQALFIDRIAHMNYTLEQAEGGSFAEAVSTIRGGEGKIKMDRVRASVEDFVAERQAQQRIMISETNRRAAIYTSIVVTGNVIVALLLLGVFLRLVVSRNKEIQARKQVMRNDEQLRLFIRNTPAAVGAMGCDLRFFLASDRWSEEFSSDWYVSPVGLTLGDVFPGYERRQDWQDAIAKVLQGESVKVEEDKISVPGAPDLWAQWELHPWHDGAGNVGAIIIAVENITKRKDMERMKDEFVSMVSHELRTPLTSIRGSLGLVAGGAAGAMDDKVKQLVDIAHKNSERLIFLINDLLDMNKIEADQMEFDMKPQALDGLLNEILQENEGYGEKHGVNIVGAGAHGADEILADRNRFKQVMANLISNAVKFSPKDKAVEVGYLDEGRNLRIFVRDHGPGIPHAFRSRIFQKFAQADSSDKRAQGGTGLGLSIAKVMVEKMGGWISFETEEGEGTTFWLEFPRHGIESPAARGDLYHILHVEDDADFYRMIRAGLDDFAHVTNARTVHDGVKAIDHDDFDLVIVDLSLPDGSGVAILEKLHGLKRSPVVIISGYDISEHAKGMADACITKAVVKEDAIMNTIRSLLKGKAAKPAKKN